MSPITCSQDDGFLDVVLRVLAFADDATGVTTYGERQGVEQDLISILEAYGMRSNAAKLERFVITKDELPARLWSRVLDALSAILIGTEARSLIQPHV